MTPTSSPPKVLLFDIGGVCVLSPMQAIQDYEITHSVPRGYVNYAISQSGQQGAWARIERGEVPMNSAWFAHFKSDLMSERFWKAYHEKLGLSPVPALVDIDAENLYWTMMSHARENDPYMYPALKKLKADGRFGLAAMSNTSIFPEGHKLNEPRADDVRRMFEVFVSSAHVGMRKPDREIYNYTLGKIKERWGESVRPQDVVFLDDIGVNLRMGREVGFRTIKVGLGKTIDAVKELQKITGLTLLDEQAQDWRNEEKAKL